jgi:nicotinamidase-related amidase
MVPRDVYELRGVEPGLPVPGAPPTAGGSAGPRASRAEAPYAGPELPRASDFKLDVPRAALVLTDPQVDFLSPRGATWGVVGQSVERNDTVHNIERLLRAARQARMVIAVSPHYYYPSGHRWGFGGPLEQLMRRTSTPERQGPLVAAGAGSSGVAFMPQYTPYLLDRRTIIASPHRVYGPAPGDLAARLRRGRVDQVVLAGMSANLCVESHLRTLLEQGFEVAVVKDATAAAMLPDGDGYLAALINFRYLANALWSTDEAVMRM